MYSAGLWQHPYEFAFHIRQREVVSLQLNIDINIVVAYVLDGVN
jgi:hypothetical protein